MQYHDQTMITMPAQGGHEGMGTVLLLAALLVGVFFLALGGYGYYAAIDAGDLPGALPNAVLALRGLVEENEAVAVFLGLAPDESVATMAPAEEVPAHIRAAAEAYIRARQE